jgi:hypothetical protein
MRRVGLLHETAHVVVVDLVRSKERVPRLDELPGTAMLTCQRVKHDRIGCVRVADALAVILVISVIPAGLEPAACGLGNRRSDPPELRDRWAST